MLRYIVLLFLFMKIIIAKQISHINDLQWSNRIIIVMNDINFEFQKKIKLNQIGIDDRKISIIICNKKEVYLDSKLMPEKFSDSVLERVENIDKNHRLILIGKDGNIKSSYLFETELEKIFYDVDKMPMRKYEMKIRNNSKTDYIVE